MCLNGVYRWTVFTLTIAEKVWMGMNIFTIQGIYLTGLHVFLTKILYCEYITHSYIFYTWIWFILHTHHKKIHTYTVRDIRTNYHKTPITTNQPPRGPQYNEDTAIRPTPRKVPNRTQRKGKIKRKIPLYSSTGGQQATMGQKAIAALPLTYKLHQVGFSLVSARIMTRLILICTFFPLKWNLLRCDNCSLRGSWRRRILFNFDFLFISV